MSHPFEYRGHYNHRGEVCHCPWGQQGKRQQERLGGIKEGSKLEWLRGRPDMQTPEGQQFLDFVRGKGINGDQKPSPFGGPQLADADKLLPWLAREWKKGRVRLPNTLHDRRMLYEDPHGLLTKGLNGGELVEAQSALEEMKKRRKGIDIMQHKVHELIPKIKDFQDWKKEQERKNLGDVLHRFDDGWSIRRLQNEDEHVDEGNLMGHCVGDRSMGYADQTERGSKIFASLRDPKNLPHATIELSPDHWKHADTGETSSFGNDLGGPTHGWIPQVGPASIIDQFYGKEDSPPLDEYADRVNDWLHPHGIFAESKPREVERIRIPAAFYVGDYLDHWHQEFDPWGMGHDEDDEGRPAGEETEFWHEDPNYDLISQNLLGGEGSEPWSEQTIRELFDTARLNYHVSDFDQALNENYNSANLEHNRVMDLWEKAKEPWYHPYTGELSQGTIQPPIKQFQAPLFEKAFNYQRVPIPTTEPWEPGHAQPEGPWTDPYTYASEASKPFYYRWIYSPTKGVTFGSNSDSHPALVPYHQELGGQVDGQDLMHGYAYRLGNGWRLTDWEHKAVEDPFVYAQVVRALGLKESPEKRSEGSWRDVEEANWDRLHYGVPASELS